MIFFLCISYVDNAILFHCGNLLLFEKLASRIKLAPHHENDSSSVDQSFDFAFCNEGVTFVSFL